MRVLIAALILVVAVALVLVIFRSWRAALRARKARWKLHLASDGDQVNIVAQKSGEKDLWLGAVPAKADDFEIRLYELQAEAQGRVAAMNEGD